VDVSLGTNEAPGGTVASVEDPEDTPTDEHSRANVFRVA